ncbi:MAG: GDSL-type esterase/lipase family protein [Pseudomonadales bacterium]|jgi:acyl-CoA thioesterase-1|nr:GDSL-type esterase/lipase family protein [Pseudomonadales bacterium]
MSTFKTLLMAGLTALLFCSAGARAQDADLPVILAVGESTTAGFGVARDKSWPAQLQALLDAEGLRYRVVNHGRSGSTTAMALGTLGDGMALQPKFVVIALGGNDRSMRLSREQTKENLRRMVSLYVRAGATVFLAERGAATDGGADAVAASLFAELAAEEGAVLIPSLREGLAGNPDLLLADMSHPNAEGYAIIAARMQALLTPYLQGAASP